MTRSRADTLEAIPAAAPGLINIANAAPQVAAPFIASAIVTTWGYSAMFPICACIALGGASLVVLVKSVR